ncbi:hypothetical protein MBRA1_002421 [Malassezia brasiliensis]|uniref:Ribosomal RNA-processing protein 1 n=1 Tax=Malassezia brasiliensis TaxID=1821822 RepID=A0AAF0DUU7_9BASI|nr:hypothetical protein MBRA1_002421 [Malassezia brasiliensis]
MPKRKERENEAVEAELPLAKYLASTEKRVRDRAIRSLSAFLLRSAQEGGLAMSQLEIAKLWKGIFYCFWMSDKPLVQQALAQELANLVLHVAGQGADVDTELDTKQSEARALSALDFFHGFWVTMEAEWLGIDKFRINKYYLLMRRMLHAALVLLQIHGWKEPILQRFALVMGGKDGPLAANNVRVPESITYHVCDIFLDELERVAEAEEGRIPMLPLLIPFLGLAAKSTSKRVYERVMGSVITPFLDAVQKEMHGKEPAYPALLAHAAISTEDDEDEEEDDEDDEEEDGNDDQKRISKLRRSLLRAAFMIASGPDTYVPSRRKLYALWQSEMQP